jgi:OFA family oxalate/formate antiporter-like MFS transporter
LYLFKSQKRVSEGWLEVIKLLLILTAIMAVRNSFGVFFTSIEEQFNLSRGATSAYFSAFMVTSTVATIITGFALDRFGPKPVIICMGALTLLSLLLTGQVSSSWQLFLTYSLLLAAGTGGGFPLVLSTVSRWFVKGRGLALGISLSGEGVGTLAVAPLAAFFISTFSWRTAYSILGLLAGAVMIGFGFILKKVPRDPPSPQSRSSGGKTKAIEAADFTLKNAMKTPSYWFLGAVYLFFSLSFYLVLTHIVPHATDLGISAGRAALIVSLLGGSTIPGRLVTGWASDRTSRKALAVGCAVCQAAAMLWLAWSSSLWMFCAFAFVFGFTFGGLSNLVATLIGDTFGVANLGKIAGTLVVGFSLGAATGPILGGFIFDATSSYFVSFLVGAGAASAAVIFLLLTRKEKGLSLSQAASTNGV